MMSGKFLQALAEDPKLEKQIGCMTGLLQIFDRHQLLIGKRLGYKKLASKGGPSLLPSSLKIHGADGDKQESFHNVSSYGAGSSKELPKPCVGSKEASSASVSEKCRALIGSPANSVELSASPLGAAKILILPKEEEMVSKSDCGNFVQIDPGTPTCAFCEQDTTAFGCLDQSLPPSDILIMPPSDSRCTAKHFCDMCRLNGDRKISEADSDLKESSQDSDHASKSTVEKVDRKASSLSARKHPDPAKPAAPRSKEQAISYADLRQSLKVLAKLKDAPWNVSHGKAAARCLLESKDGSRHSSLKDPPRISYDQPRSSFEFKDCLRASQRSKESPRFSLDVDPPKPCSEFKNSLRSHSYKDDLRSISDGESLLLQPQIAINSEASFKDSSVDSKKHSPGLVARLMGLEAIPDKALTCPSTPSKFSREAKLLQGLLDYTPPHGQDKPGSDRSFPADSVEKKQVLSAKSLQLSKQFSDAVKVFPPEKDRHMQAAAGQLQSSLIHLSRASPKVLSGVWPHLDNALKPLSAPRCVMEIMPPHHKIKALYQHKPVVDALASFAKSSKSPKIMDPSFDEETEKPCKRQPTDGAIKQQKSWDDILKNLSQPELFKLSEYFRQAEKAAPAQLDRSSNSPHGSKVPKEQLDGMLRKYFPATDTVKVSSKAKHQVDRSGNASKPSRRIVNGANSSVSGLTSGSSSKSSPLNACKEMNDPRRTSSTCVSNRSGRSQQNLKLLMGSRDDPDAMPRIKHDLAPPARSQSPHPQRIRSPLKSGSQFSLSKKMNVLSPSLENQKACAVRNATPTIFRPLSLIKSFRDDPPDAYENSGGVSCKQPPENIFLQRSNSDAEMPSLESYDSSEGDLVSDQHLEGLSLERIEVLSNYTPHDPQSQTEAETFRIDTSKTKDELMHQKDMIEAAWMPENPGFEEQIFSFHNSDENEPPAAAARANLLPQIPVIQQKAPPFSENYARHLNDQPCLPIDNLMTRVQRTEVVKSGSFPEIEPPLGRLNSSGEMLRTNSSIGSTEKHCEQPSPSSVLDAACILDSFSPRIHTANFGLRSSIPAHHERDYIQAYDSLVDAEIAASLPAEEKLTPRIKLSLRKGEMEACSDPKRVVMTDTEEFMYIHKILTASNYADQIGLSSGLWCSQEKSVSSDYFVLIEQANNQTGYKSKEEPSLKKWSSTNRLAEIYRRLVFDSVNDVLETRPHVRKNAQNLSNSSQLNQPKKLSIEQISHVVCSALQDLRRHSSVDVSGMLYSMIEKDLPKNEHWHEFSTETRSILLAIERSIFKQLIEEAIDCLTPTSSRRSFTAKHNHCRKKLF